MKQAPEKRIAVSFFLLATIFTAVAQANSAHKIEVREGGLVANLWLPASPGPAPGVLLLGGSGGGIDWQDHVGESLATHGFVALALGYFGLEGLPDELERIPLEYIEHGLTYLRLQPRVDRERVGVVGVSKGGELALLLASMRPELRAVVAFVPSGFVWQNVASGFPDSSSWSYRGADVAFVHYGSVDQPRGIIDFYRAGIEQATPETLAAATIPVELINGPILLLSGRDDNLWPSTDLSERVVARLAEQGFGYPVEHKAYENAGHLISRVRDEDVSRRGGTDQGNRTAQLDARERMVTFLRQHLMPREAVQAASNVSPIAINVSQSISEFVKPFAEAKHFSGVLYVVQRDELVFHQAFGLANASFGIPNTTDTRVGIASVTKDLTLAIANQLIDRGLITEQAVVNQFIPGFPSGDKITIAMLAMHRSGIPHRVGADSSKAYMPADIVQLAKDQELAFEPGTGRLYSSAGYTVLARILEIASGETYQELLDRYVFGPADMERSYDFQHETVSKDQAESYLLDSKGYLNAPLQDYSFLAGAGSVFSTAQDVYKFGQAGIAGRLGKSAKSAMVNSKGNVVANGSTNGFRCNLYINPSKEYGYVLVSNLASGANDLVERNIQRILEGEEAIQAKVPKPRIVSSESSDLNDFTGTYKLGGSRFTVENVGGILMAGPYKLLPMGDGSFYNYWSYAKITFQRNDDGQVNALIWDGSAGKTTWDREN